MQKKLLVADDSITIQKVVRLTFAGEDIAIESVADGDLAIRKVREFRPDIVLADILMPGRNGYEVCEKVKSDPEFSKIPVVLIAGTFEPFDEVEAGRVKCDAWLTKPFDTSELLQVVHSLIGTKGAETPRTSRKKADAGVLEVRRNKSALTEPPPGARLVSDRTLDSFLGSDRVLDLFGPENRIPVSARHTPPPPSGPATELADELSEEALDKIVDRVVRRMSQDVVREIAWEVVPEMSELIIRQCLEEKGKL